MSRWSTRITGILTSATLGVALLAPPAAAAEVTDQVSGIGPSGTGQSAWFGDSQTVAQLFTAGISGTLTQATVSIGRQGTTNTNFTIGVYATAAGKPTGSALAQVAFDATAAGALAPDRSAATTVTARFASPPTVACGTTYALVISTTDPYPSYHWFIGTYGTFNSSIYGDQVSSPGTWHEYSPYPGTFSTTVEPSSGYTATAPTAPTSLAATPGNGSASVAFTAPSGCWTSITNYEYEVNGSGTWTALSPADAASPVTIPGLTNGAEASIRLRARNSTGAGTPSAAVTVTPATTPSAPTALAATAGNGSASIAFEAGSDGGSAISNYEFEAVNVDDPSVSTGWVALAPADSTSPVVVPGLANGTEVSIRLRAVNAIGAGSESVAVTVTPSAPPSGGAGGTGGAGSSSGGITEVEPPTNRADRTAPSLDAVAVPEPIAVGEGLVIVDGRSSKVSVQVVSGRKWSVRGEDFQMEFVPQALQGELEGTFTARAGSWVDVTGDGYQPGTLVATYLPGVLAPSLGEERVQADGTFSVRARFPATLAVGQYVLQVNGLASPTSVRSVNLGLMLLAAETSGSVKPAVAKRIMFRPGSAALTPAARATITRFVAAHRGSAASAVVVPTVAPGATSWARYLAVRRAEVVVAAMRASGLAVPARPARKVRVASDAGAATRTTAWIRQ